MSNSCPEPKFESIGTIHYSYRVSNTDECLFFVPDSNHYLKYSGNSYAVFVSVPPDSKTTPANKDVRSARAVRLRNNDNRGIFLEKSVPIETPNCANIRDALLQIAEKQAIVTVTIKKKNDNDNNESLELVGITFPAR